MTSDYIDISVPLKTGMVHWPDNPPVSIEKMLDMNHGDICNVSKISMGSHTGTHMDSPVHFVKGGLGIDRMPLEATLGLARVIEIKDTFSIKTDELKKQALRKGERILFKTVNSSRCWKTDQFMEDFVFISHEAAQYLVDCGVQTVGVDYLSVGGYKIDGVETHQILLKAGIWIIEGLDLSKVNPGNYELICLPLKVVKGDGAPARAILKRI